MTGTGQNTKLSSDAEGLSILRSKSRFFSCCMVTFFASFAASGFDDGEEEIWLFKRGGFEAEKIRRPFSPKQNKSPARIDFYV
jgi:hypothetical protein